MVSYVAAVLDFIAYMPTYLDSSCAAHLTAFGGLSEIDHGHTILVSWLFRQWGRVDKMPEGAIERCCPVGTCPTKVRLGARLGGCKRQRE